MCKARSRFYGVAAPVDVLYQDRTGYSPAKDVLFGQGIHQNIVRLLVLISHELQAPLFVAFLISPPAHDSGPTLQTSTINSLTSEPISHDPKCNHYGGGHGPVYSKELLYDNSFITFLSTEGINRLAISRL